MKNQLSLFGHVNITYLIRQSSRTYTFPSSSQQHYHGGHFSERQRAVIASALIKSIVYFVRYQPISDFKFKLSDPTSFKNSEHIITTTLENNNKILVEISIARCKRLLLLPSLSSSSSSSIPPQAFVTLEK